MTTPETAPVEVTQVDCDASQAYLDDPRHNISRFTTRRILDEAFARHRLTTRQDGLREALEKTRDTLRKLQPALNLMARDVIDDIIANQIDAPLNANKGEV